MTRNTVSILVRHLTTNIVSPLVHSSHPHCTALWDPGWAAVVFITPAIEHTFHKATTFSISAVRGTCLLKMYCSPALFIAENDRRSIDRLTHWLTHIIDIEQNTIVILSVSQSSEFCHMLVCSFATVQFKCQVVVSHCKSDATWVRIKMTDGTSSSHVSDSTSTWRNVTDDDDLVATTPGTIHALYSVGYAPDHGAEL